MKHTGKMAANKLAMSRKAGYKSNLTGMAKGPTKIPGTNYGHVKMAKGSGTTRFKG